MDWQTFGHNRIKNILEKQVETSKFAHAYLFMGPEGLGKKMLALELAKKILKTEKLENYPDFQMLNIDGEITMDLALDFISRLSLKPFMGQKKVAIINNAHNLNLQSGNALLKTLEEPSPSTIIILISDTNRILPTIISRCQVLNFSPLTRVDLEGLAETKNAELTEDIINLSFGRPGRLLKFLADKDFLKKQQEIIKNYETALASPVAEKLISIASLADLEPLELTANLQTWFYWQVSRLKQFPSEFGKVRALDESLTALEMNKNKKLVLQGLMLKI